MIGILNTWSDLNSCHMHFKTVVENVKRGILQAGGMPLEVPVMSCGETYTKPTSMLYRNFLAMETEEVLRSNPLDGAVLLGGCDKTTPALLMGAISVDLPVIYVPGGPMLRGAWRGKRSAAVRTFGNTGRKGGLAIFPSRHGKKWNAASHVRPDTA